MPGLKYTPLKNTVEIMLSAINKVILSFAEYILNLKNTFNPIVIKISPIINIIILMLKLISYLPAIALDSLTNVISVIVKGSSLYISLNLFIIDKVVNKILLSAKLVHNLLKIR